MCAEGRGVGVVENAGIILRRSLWFGEAGKGGSNSSSTNLSLWICTNWFGIGCSDQELMANQKLNANLQKYNGRLGRVVDDPPPWLITSTSSTGAAWEGLIPVLLESRSTDRDRSNGLWVAVPAANLRPL